MVSIPKDKLSCISDWVFRKKAAEIIGINFTCIDRNAYAGLYPFRVVNGRQMYYAPMLTTGVMGNPLIVSREKKTLNREDQKIVRDYKKQLEKVYEDFVLEVVYEKGEFFMDVTYQKNGNYYHLPRKRVFEK